MSLKKMYIMLRWKNIEYKMPDVTNLATLNSTNFDNKLKDVTSN